VRRTIIFKGVVSGLPVLGGPQARMDKSGNTPLSYQRIDLKE
jgi:hypothetical protein